MRYLILLLTCAVAALSNCTHHPDLLGSQGNKPFNLIYTPAYIVIPEGSFYDSEQPTIEGDTTIAYTLSVSPFVSPTQVTIDSLGIIHIDSSLELGSYNVTVIASNGAGSTTFTNVFTFDVSDAPTAPFNMNYSPNSISLVGSNTGNSVVPTIQGTMPITYSMTTSPATTEISMDGQGVISATANLAIGTYSVSVTATNSIGSTVFNDIYTVSKTSSAAPPSNLSYLPSGHNKPQGTSGTSPTPNVSGTTPMTFTMIVTPSTPGITINSNTGVITSDATVPVGTYNIDVTATNVVGSTAFFNTYTVTISTPPTLVSYANDILPIIQNKCANCHTSGPQTIYTNYTNASTNASMIYDRVTRTQGSAGYMPKNRPPLSQQEQDLIGQWITDGLQP